MTYIEPDALRLDPLLQRPRPESLGAVASLESTVTASAAQEAVSEEDSKDDPLCTVSAVVDAGPPSSIGSTLASRKDPPRRAHGREPPPLPMRSTLTKGHIVSGRFRLEQKVGCGGMGEVWAAEDLVGGERVAVKVLLPRALRVPEIVARFEREATLLSRLQGKHTPRFIEYSVEEAYGPVLVTQFVAGQSLAVAIEPPLSVEQAVDMAIDLTTALLELHDANVVHRDLKPSNVILHRASNGKKRVVLIDFGVSRLLCDSNEDNDMAEISTGGVAVGTVEYMAPEQIVPSGQVTPAADLYALGALIFRAVAGTHVFGAGLDRMEVLRLKLTTEAPPLPTGRRDPVAWGLAKVVARALARNPAARYQSASELRADLHHVRARMKHAVWREWFDVAGTETPAAAGMPRARAPLLASASGRNPLAATAISVVRSWIRGERGAVSSSAPRLPELQARLVSSPARRPSATVPDGAYTSGSVSVSPRGE